MVKRMVLILALATAAVLAPATGSQAAVDVHHGTRLWCVGGCGPNDSDFWKVNVLVNESDITHNLEALADPATFGAQCERWYTKQMQLHRVIAGTDVIVLVEDKLVWRDCFDSGQISTGWYQSCTDGNYYARWVGKVEFSTYTTGLKGLNSFAWTGDAGSGC